nr:MAG TPA: hypothetical protein [Caudoviricetes sp.]
MVLYMLHILRFIEDMQMQKLLLTLHNHLDG